MIVRGKMKIIVDTREQGIIPKLDKYREIYKDVEFEIQTLDAGDYYYQLGSILIERKTMLDFYSSTISNGRIFEQIAKMKEVIDNPILVITGSLKEAFIRIPNFNINVVRGAIASIVTKHKISVLMFPTDNEFIHTLVKMCEKSTEPLIGLRNRLKVKDEYIYRNMLSCIPGISYKKANSILEKYTLNQVIQAKEEDLQTIEGVGPKLSSNIKTYLSDK